jgi:signal transduction histidine kinase/DNA-binding response OmpR family regulator
MKRLYLLLLTVGAVYLIMLTRSLWWLLAGALGFMTFLLYRIYASRLYTSQIRATALEQKVEELHDQLDTLIRKDQRLSKAAEQATEIKKRLLAALSHEIRTPMNGVMGMASLLVETKLDSQQREYVSGIRNCGEQLIAVVNHILVDDILNISKGEDNGQLVIEDFDLRSCIEEVLDMFAGAGGKKGPELLYQISEGVPVQIAGDSSRLRQILINLVENAVKFTSQGEIFIGIRLIGKEDDQLELEFEVRDTGIGIPANKIAKIFEGLSGTASPDEDKENTGLGLVICRRLVEMMKGWIEVQSQPGKGCTFTFCVRMSPGRKPLRNSLHPGMMALQDKRILVVDDNALSLSLLTTQLQQWGTIPVAATSGLQVTNLLLAEAPFDLVIINEDMPGADGIQLARSIRQQYPAIPLMLLSRTGNQEQPVEEGIFSFVLAKPVRQHIMRDQLLHLFYSGTERRSAKSSMENLPADFSATHPLRLLIAEDNPINQKIALKLLSKLGYEPRIVSDGKEALDELSQQRYDLVFMDVQMPGMDGLEATKMIRLCLDIQPVIIAMTANAMQGDRDNCMQAGMDDYISKPIEMEELLAQLEKWSAVINR